LQEGGKGPSIRGRSGSHLENPGSTGIFSTALTDDNLPRILFAANVQAAVWPDIEILNDATSPFDRKALVAALESYVAIEERFVNFGVPGPINDLAVRRIASSRWASKGRNS
jgi:hypothetical protein